MLGEYPNGISPNARRFVEYIGREALDGVPQGQKLRLPGDALRALDAGQFVHRGVADLALDRLAFVLVQHRKLERQPLVIVAHDFVLDQRHRSTSSHAAGKNRRPRPAIPQDAHSPPRGGDACVGLQWRNHAEFRTLSARNEKVVGEPATRTLTGISPSLPISRISEPDLLSLSVKSSMRSAIRSACQSVSFQAKPPPRSRMPNPSSAGVS